MKFTFPFGPLFLTGALFLCACSTTRMKETETSSPSKESALPSPSVNESSVEIDYLLGRDHYHYLAKQKDLTATALTTLDGQILVDGPVDYAQYQHFLRSAIALLNGIRHSSTPPESMCRSPFKITIRMEKKTETTHGCRSSDKGAFSKLIKEGEFLLLYSKN